MSDVHFDDVADGFSFVANRCIHGYKVLNCAEKYAAQKNPEKHGHPAENCRLNRCVDGACAGDGCKLVSEHNAGLCRDVVYAVLKLVCGGFCLVVNAPGFDKISSVQKITQAQNRRGYDKN